MDSSPSSALLFYELEHGPNDPAALEHIFGGPPFNADGSPTEFYDSYQLASARVFTGVRSAGPATFAHFNALDTVTPVNHAHALRDAIANHGEPGSGVHDHNHPYPGQDFLMFRHWAAPTMIRATRPQQCSTFQRDNRFDGLSRNALPQLHRWRNHHGKLRFGAQKPQRRGGAVTVGVGLWDFLGTTN